MDAVHRLEQEISQLKETLHRKEQKLQDIKQKLLPTKVQNYVENGFHDEHSSPKMLLGESLPKWAIERYSRQILLPDIGVEGQRKLMAARVLVVGAGGLGCPAAAYLAGAGVGEIGVVDYDRVDLTNIHRQMLHSESDQHLAKAESAANSLRSINSKIKITPYNLDLNPTNALDIAAGFDMILDCTDNVPTRYMLSDVSVLSKIPLISGSALKMEGQLTIYGYRRKTSISKEGEYEGPCYRCLFPTPPPPEAVGSCSANGVAGPVPGVIGALQALEAIKLIVGRTRTQLLVQRMLLFDGEDMTFRTVKLRPRNTDCDICSENPRIKRLMDYEVLCKSQAKEKDFDLNLLPIEKRISATDLANSLNGKQSHLLVDVRSEAEFSMCRIDGAVNYPLESLPLDQLLNTIRESTGHVTFVCRRGNDSQIAAKKVLDLVEEQHQDRIRDLAGGLHSWAEHVDRGFPIY